MEDSNLVQKPWYKTGGGITAILFLVLIGGAFLIFMATTGYYIYLSKFGSAEKWAAINNEFTVTFTDASGAAVLGRQTLVERPIAEMIREHNPTAGNPDAAVTIVAFIDFECPFCREAFPIFQEVKQKYQSAAQIVFKHFPLASIHPRATDAGLAAQCAHAQGKFWEYYELMFTAQGLDTQSLNEYARTIGLNTVQFERCMSSEQFLAEIQQDVNDGVEFGVAGTPTFFVNQRKVEGVTPKDAWNQIIVGALQGDN